MEVFQDYMATENGGTKKGEVDISPEFIADVGWPRKLFSLQTSNHGNLEIC